MAGCWSITLLVVLGLASCSYGGMVPVFTQEPTIDSYLYMDNFPASTKFTACFNLYTEPETDNRENGYLLSIANDKDDDEFRIKFDGLILTVRSNNRAAISTDPTELDELFHGWHKHCFVWQTSDKFSWYADRNQTIPGKMELIKSVSTSWYPVREASTLMLLQEQNSNPGSLNVANTVAGKITSFNMWSDVLTLEQIQRVGCRDSGDLVAWENMKVYGSTTLQNEFVPCDDGGETMEATREAKKQQATLCRINGAGLSATYKISTVTAGSPARCALACAENSSCKSANYQKSTKTCDLNNDIDVSKRIADFSIDLGDDYIHFTTRACH